jgi:multiple sugar transport system substrate-binding protein
MKKRTILTLGGLTCLSLGLLTSCGDSGDYVEPGATKITMYCQSFEDWSNTHLSKMVKEFNSIKDDGIQLDVKLFEDSVYTDGLTSARENNSAPDIFMCSYGNLYHDVIEPGYGEPLDDLLGADAINDILPNVKTMVSYKNKVYAYPQLIEPSTVFYYRKSVLSRAGVNSVPTTWDELLKACAKVLPNRKKGQYVLGMPIGTALGWATYGMQINTTGGLAVNDKWDESLVDGDGYRQLNGFFYDIYANNYCPAGNVSPKGYNDIIEGLCEDKLAMTFAGSWSLAEVAADYPDVLDDIGVGVIPTLDGDTSKCSATNGGWTYAISSTSKNKEKAASVLKWFFTEDTERTASFFEDAAYSKAATTTSVQKYLASHVSDEYKDFLTVINKVSANAQAEPKYLWSISTAVGAMFETMAVKCDSSKGDEFRTKTINNAITTADATIKSIISGSGYKTNPYLD